MYNIIAIMGQSGAGKDSIMEAVLDRFPLAAPVHEIISCTSRPMRQGEVNGVNYYYYTPD
jgi:guanylate kinase